VLQARSADAALRIAATLPQSPELVLIDPIMPHRSGRALADELRERWPTINVLFMSGYTDVDISRRGLLDSGTLHPGEALHGGERGGGGAAGARRGERGMKPTLAGTSATTTRALLIRTRRSWQHADVFRTVGKQ
jgi:CheY-like chemotaxis protein